MNSPDFLSQIDSLVKDSSKVNKQKVSAPKKTRKSTKEANVTFNMRINESLRNQFHELCYENDTTMSREIKRFIRSAVANQEL
ncbi:hypothetical protein IOD06_00505 [Psychrobacter sp. N25K4-3-2]|uniref:hypothetical protein n=1 Tax=Psychrobacter sp. N25K4-3-2 TaxID=2785026 RepID=UPI00188B0280|nr:hypothetical protein [Psychrobacter sp. N25K4-3-2]MBF4488369.1 hypothetical protein [Psychrobacter sp. N25K4-3-2]